MKKKKKDIIDYKMYKSKINNKKQKKMRKWKIEFEQLTNLKPCKH